MRRLSIRTYITYLIFFMCAVAAWGRGGIYRPAQWPVLLAAVVLTILPFFLDQTRRSNLWSRLKKDPVFYAGLLLQPLLLIQLINSGYRVVYGQTAAEVEFVRTPAWWMPWSVERSDAFEVIVWFFPAWVSVLLIRHVLHRKHIFMLLYLLAASSALLAAIGIAQIVFGAEKILGIWNSETAFYSSFGYVNHACAFFYLNAFLAGGLAYRAFERKRPWVQVSVWIMIFALCVTSLFFTLSRFGVVVAAALIAVFLGIFIKGIGLKGSREKKVNISLIIGIVVLIGTALLFGAGGGTLADELGGKSLTGEVSVWADLNVRLRRMPAVFQMIADYPVFGTGGWGYRWIWYLYEPYEQWGELSGMGLANVHCDPLQFLSEFGLAGMVLIGGSMGVLVGGVIKAKEFHGMVLILFAGVCVVMLHSFIDLPFRSPAILLEWIVLLAAVPRVSVWGRAVPDPLLPSDRH